MYINTFLDKNTNISLTHQLGSSSSQALKSQTDDIIITDAQNQKLEVDGGITNDVDQQNNYDISISL